MGSLTRRLLGAPSLVGRQPAEPRLESVTHVLRKYDPDEWGGTETAVQHLMLGLRGQSVISKVLAPALPPGAERRAERRAGSAADPFTASGFRVDRYQAFLPVLGISPADRERMVAVGGNLMSLDLPYWLMRGPAPSIVHGHALGRVGALARICARARRAPFVLSIHGGVLDLPDRVRDDLTSKSSGLEYGKIFGLLLRSRQLLSDADAILTCNPREAELLAAKLPRQRIVCMPHGVPTEVYATDHRALAERTWPSLRHRKVMLNVGRIDTVKNQIFLVDNLPALLGRFPDLLVVLAGPITDAAHDRLLETTITRLGVGNHVLRTGGTPPLDPRLIGLYQRADLFALPSLSETFGLVIAEAWAAGTAVISSRTSGALQLMEHGTNGRLFDLQAPNTFVDAATHLLADAQAAEFAARAGAEKVRRELSIDAVASRYVDLYESLIAAKHRRLVAPGEAR